MKIHHDIKKTRADAGATPMMKHNLLMIVGCGLPLLLIFLLPALGMGTGWAFAVAFVAMVACHLMHFGAHNHRENGNKNNDHQR